MRHLSCVCARVTPFVGLGSTHAFSDGWFVAEGVKEERMAKRERREMSLECRKEEGFSEKFRQRRREGGIVKFLCFSLSLTLAVVSIHASSCSSSCRHTGCEVESSSVAPRCRWKNQFKQSLRSGQEAGGRGLLCNA